METSHMNMVMMRVSSIDEKKTVNPVTYRKFQEQAFYNRYYTLNYNQ